MPGETNHAAGAASGRALGRAAVERLALGQDAGEWPDKRCAAALRLGPSGMDCHTGDVSSCGDRPTSGKRLARKESPLAARLPGAAPMDAPVFPSR